MKVSELITALENLQMPDAEVRIVTTDLRTSQSDLISVECDISRTGATIVTLSDE